MSFLPLSRHPHPSPGHNLDGGAQPERHVPVPVALAEHRSPRLRADHRQQLVRAKLVPAADRRHHPNHLGAGVLCAEAV